MASKFLGALILGGIGAAVVILNKVRITKFLSSKKRNDGQAEENKSPFFCPLSGELMEDPVITPYGTYYERENIEQWIEENGTCPTTKKALAISDLKSSPSLRLAIRQYKQTLPSE